MSLTTQALYFAAQAHDGQRRKGTDVPYIVHPVSVAMRLLKIAADEKAVAGALLHDTLEDTSTTYDDLSGVFGKDIADIVADCSECDKSKSWEERKQHTIDKIKTQPLIVRLIECSDKLDNCTSMIEEYRKYGDEAWARFKRGFEDQKWYFTSLDSAFRSHNDLGEFTAFFAEFHEAVAQFVKLKS